MLWIEAGRERYATDGKPPVEWQQYLEVAPGLSGLDPEARTDALAARGLDIDAWTRADSYWVLTFALDLQQGRTDRVEAYGRACAEARREQAEATVDAAEENQGEAAAPPEPGPVVAPVLQVPSFLRNDPAPVSAGSPWTAAPADLHIPQDAAPALAGVAPDTEMDRLRGTVALSPFAVPAPATPFVPGVSPLAVPNPSTPAATRPSGETVALPGPMMEPRRAAPQPARGPAPASTQVLSPQPERSPRGTVALDPTMIARILAQTQSPKQ